MDNEKNNTSQISAIDSQLKKGYKQTEIGVIPVGWEVKTLGELGEIKMCRRVFNDETKEKGDIPFYKIGTFGKTADAYISKGLYEKYKNNFSFPRKGDILISAAGTIGRTVVYDGKPSYFQDSNIVWIDNDESVVINKYLSYIYKIVNYNTEGGTIQRLYNSIIKSAEFACPPKPEQIAIATALSDADALIEKLEKLIAKKKAVKQGAMQQLLTGKRRLPGFRGEWSKKLMHEIGKTYGGLSGKVKADFGNGNSRYIPFMNIMSNPIIDITYFDKVNIKANETQAKAQKNDLFFNGSSETPEEVGMCSVLLGEISNLYLNSFCFGFRLNKDLKTDGLWLSYFFRSSIGRELIYSLAQGATRYNLSKTNFLKLEIPYPEPEEQTAIATVLSDMDAEIEALETSLSKYRHVKNGMMQQLLTGKIRLVNNSL